MEIANRRIEELEREMLKLGGKMEDLEEEVDSLRDEFRDTYINLREDISGSFKESNDLRASTREELSGKISELTVQQLEVKSEYNGLKTELKNVVNSNERLVNKIDGRDKVIMNTIIGFIVSVILLVLGAYVIV